MNNFSSRSHSLFSFYLYDPLNPSRPPAKLVFVDLAGSERNNRSKSIGKAFTEAKKINLSLLTLEKVVLSFERISDGDKAHFPFRESNLTLLLKDMFLSDTSLSIICNISPEKDDLEETIHTLKFCSRCKNLKIRIVEPKKQLQLMNIPLTPDMVPTKIADEMRNELQSIRDELEKEKELRKRAEEEIKRLQRLLDPDEGIELNSDTISKFKDMAEKFLDGSIDRIKLKSIAEAQIYLEFLRELKDSQNQNFLKQTKEIKKKLDNYTTYHEQQLGHLSSKDIGEKSNSDKREPKPLQRTRSGVISDAGSKAAPEKDKPSPEGGSTSAKGIQEKTPISVQTAPVALASLTQPMMQGYIQAIPQLVSLAPPYIQLTHQSPHQLINNGVYSQVAPMNMAGQSTLPISQLASPAYLYPAQTPIQTSQQGLMPPFVNNQLPPQTQSSLIQPAQPSQNLYPPTVNTQPYASQNVQSQLKEQQPLPTQPISSSNLQPQASTQPQPSQPTMPISFGNSMPTSSLQQYPQQQPPLQNYQSSAIPLSQPQQSGYQQSSSQQYPPNAQNMQFGQAPPPAFNIFKDSIIEELGGSRQMDSTAVQQRGLFSTASLNDQPVVSNSTHVDTVTFAPSGPKTNGDSSPARNMSPPPMNSGNQSSNLLSSGLRLGGNSASLGYALAGQASLNSANRNTGVSVGQQLPPGANFYPLSPVPSTGQENFKPLISTQSGPAIQATTSPEAVQQLGTGVRGFNNSSAVYTGLPLVSSSGTRSISPTSTQPSTAYDALLSQRQKVLGNPPPTETRFPRTKNEDKFDRDTKGDDIKIDN